MDIAWGCGCCDEASDETIETDICARRNSNTNNMKLYDDDRQPDGDSVIQFVVKSFFVLNENGDYVSCPDQAHAYAATRINIDISYCMNNMRCRHRS